MLKEVIFEFERAAKRTVSVCTKPSFFLMVTHDTRSLVVSAMSGIARTGTKTAEAMRMEATVFNWTMVF